jgi:transposase
MASACGKLLMHQLNFEYFQKSNKLKDMEKELRTGAKHLGQEAQYQIRKIIVRMLKSGETGKQIAKLLDVSEGHVSGVKKAYETNGIAGIKPGKRGRRQGEKRTLTLEQEREVQKIIVDKTPEQLKFRECMWSRSNIRDLIKQKYKIDMPLSSLGYYLARWGFSVQRPRKRAYKQDAQKVQNWVEEEFPGIAARAKEEGGEIFFGDETGLQNQATYQRGYAPIGKTPVVRTEAKHIKINMLSAISNRGKLRFVLYRDNMNADKLIDFMRRLVHDSKKKVFFVLDNLRVHHSKKVAAWLEKHKDEIEIFFLPPYAPEYNPDELLNSDLKRGISKRPSPRSDKELGHNVRSHLKTVQMRPDKIKGFFGSDSTCYAA